jgi:hypothetical protein
MEIINFAYLLVMPLALMIFLRSKNPVRVNRKVNTGIL